LCPPDLEKQLAKVIRERDDLSRDVELLCTQNSSSIFDSSMVLSERIYSAEKDLSRTKTQVAIDNLLAGGRMHEALQRVTCTGANVHGWNTIDIPPGPPPPPPRSRHSLTCCTSMCGQSMSTPCWLFPWFVIVSKPAKPK